jgi:small subunit ribosomal protein S7
MRGQLRLHPHKTNAFRDPVYDSFMLSKFMNFFVKKGRKAKIQNIFFNVLSNEMSKQYSSYFVFFEMLEKFKPKVGIVSVKKRGVIHNIPIPITPERKYKLALRYFYNYIRRNKDGPIFELNIRNQFRHIFFSKRLNIVELEDNKKHAIEGRVFSHYRWK